MILVSQYRHGLNSSSETCLVFMSRLATSFRSCAGIILTNETLHRKHVNYCQLYRARVRLSQAAKKRASGTPRSPCLHGISTSHRLSIGKRQSREKTSFVRNAFKRLETAAKRQAYVDVGYVLPTSNERERFFSQAKLVFSDLR